MAVSSLALDLGRLQNILVVKPDRIGDFILATPFLRGLRASAPKAKIYAAVSPAAAPLAFASPYIDYFVAMRIDPQARALDINAPDQRHGQAFGSAMNRRAFDLTVVPVFDFDSYGAGFLAKQSGAKHVVGFAEGNTPLKAERNKGDDKAYYTDVLKRSAAAHEVEHNLALLDFIGGKRAGDAVEAVLGAADKATGAKLAAEARRRLGVERLIAVAPVAGYRAKELPPEMLARIAGEAAKALGAGIVILADPRHAQLGGAVAELLKGRAVDLSGKTTLPVAAVVIGESAAVIAMCAAPGHVAAALGIPAVVFSCHPKNSREPAHFHSPLRFRPWAAAERALVIQPEKPQAPCTVTCAANESHCIGAIGLEATVEQVKNFLAAAANNTAKSPTKAKAAPVR